jgi:adenosylcobinamide kinase/adenosylcobinamide-phosphate guanylyltransferase
MLTLILGGARSGKSRMAQKLAMPSGRVVFVATAQAAGDVEMAGRIEHHRDSRPSTWRTIEEPLALANAVEEAVQDADTVLVDCLTIWLANLFLQRKDETSGDVEDAARAELGRLARAADHCHVILVSNELGSGTVPEPAITRAFRDTHGLLNQWAAEAANQVILMVAGLPLYLKVESR